jgi:hypothetical protein
MVWSKAYPFESYHLKPNGTLFKCWVHWLNTLDCPNIYQYERELLNAKIYKETIKGYGWYPNG